MDEFLEGTGDVTTRPSGTIWPQAVKVTIPDSFVVGPMLDTVRGRSGPSIRAVLRTPLSLSSWEPFR